MSIFFITAKKSIKTNTVLDNDIRIIIENEVVYKKEKIMKGEVEWKRVAFTM